MNEGMKWYKLTLETREGHKSILLKIDGKIVKSKSLERDCGVTYKKIDKYEKKELEGKIN
jgi:hypothetical protein